MRTIALVAVLATAGTALAGSVEQPWKPDVVAAKHYALHRHGLIAFAVRTPTRAWGWRAYRTFPSASLLKAILLVAYLDRPSVRSRELRASDRALLAPMIRRSDNFAAGRVLGLDGSRAVYGVASRAGMRRFRLVTGIWGLSRVDAADQARFFLHVDSLVTPRHRAYAMRLLNTITPAQRWGIARVRPSGWTLYFKGGWGSGTGWVDHQTALLTRGDQRVSISILTFEDGSHPYGKQTLQGIAARLLRGLDSADDVP
jgi:beta-lactamase family protein